MDSIELLYNPTTWLVVVSLVVFYLYRQATAGFDFFEKQGISGPKPLPVVGNLWGIWRQKLPEYDVRMVQKYGKTFGFFDATTPVLYTIDKDLIKSVFIKDFDRFVNRRDFNIKMKVFRMFVSLMKDQQWKDVRSSVSPTFTTGKIKKMSGLIKECADRLSQKLDAAIADNDGKFDVKKMFSSYSIDVIARCAFGMKIDNLGEDGDPFVKNASSVFNTSLNRTPSVLIPFVLQRLGRFLANFFLETKELRFFIDIAEDLLKTREGSSQKYNDFVEIATEALKESVRTDPSGKTVPMWTKDEAAEIVTAQSVLFLLAGFDTTGTALTNACFMLAKHPEVQEKLYNEISDKLHQTGGDIDHDLVNDIPYVDQVINETLRLYPPAPRVERECSRDVTYGQVTIRKGMVVSVPVQALHLCEEYYPDPQRFDPDRWSPGSKNQISPYVFLPFGTGPRNCVGMRFAMEAIKFALCTIVNKFRINIVDETPDKVQLQEGLYGVIQLEDFKLGVELR